MLPMSIITTAFGYGIGLGPVPHALLGELLPLKIKSIGTAIIMTLKWDTCCCKKMITIYSRET